MSTCIVTPDAIYGFLELAIVAAGIVFMHFTVRRIINMRMSRVKG